MLTTRLLRHDEAPPDAKAAAEMADAERIIVLCAGGRENTLTSDVTAGLAKYMTDVRAHTSATHNDLGAIIAKVTPDAAGADFYRQYQDCIRTQTLMHLWPNGHVPPEYLPTVGPAPPPAAQPAADAPPRPYTDADFAADALYVKQTLADHGAYAGNDVFKHLEFDGRVSLDVKDGVLSVWDEHVFKGRRPTGASFLRRRRPIR